jgi:ABC-2 type transport system permease protein
VSRLGPLLRVLSAAALKEWRIRRRYPAFLTGVFLYPLLLPAMYVLQAAGFSGHDPQALAAFAHRAGTSEVAGFLYVGGSMYMWVSIMLWGPGSALQEERVRGTLEQVFVTPASRFGILFGPMPVHVVQTLWLFLVVFTALRVVFQVPIGPDDVLRTLVVVAIAMPALIATGALFAAAVVRLRDVSGAFQAARGMFQLLCGMTFPIVVLPGWAQAISRSLPPTYVIGDIRQTLLASAPLARVLPDFLILLAMALALGLLATVAFRATERSGRRAGNLGQY